MSRLPVCSNGLFALAIALAISGCGGPKPEEVVEKISPVLNASVPGRGSGILWRFPSGELRVWDMASSTSYKEFSLGSRDPTLWQPVGTGDFAAHGASDILWRNGRDRLVNLWFMADTRVTFTSPVTSDTPIFLPGAGRPVYVGDLDGDGTSDVIWTGAVLGAFPVLPSYTAATYMMNPGTTVPRSVSTVSSPTDQVVGVGNFDGDLLRRADVLHRTVSGDVSIVLGGGGTMSFGNVANDWVVKGVGDFNGDQASDILWQSTSSGMVALWVMGPAGIVSGPVPGTVPASSGWTIQGIADVDHDGISDIVWRHTSNVLSIWMMNPDGTVREYGASVPIDPNATFAGVLELGAPAGPLNPFISQEYLQNGHIVMSVRFNGQPLRPNDSIEVLETDSRASPFRVPYHLAVVPDLMEAIVDTSQFFSGARACFRVRVWEQGRVSAYSNALCSPGLPAPTPSLTWRANDGFGFDQNQDGAINLVPSPGAVNLLRQGRWPVMLDACASHDDARGTITNYAWTVAFPTGPLTVSTPNCRVAIPAPKGPMATTLTVTTQDGRTATDSTTIDAKTYLIVSLGDSYASGEGNPVRDVVPLREPAFWGTPSDTACHRSPNSGPARAALVLERSDPHSSVVFLSVACSGAVISDLIDTNQVGAGPQIQQVRNVLCPAGTGGNCNPGDMPPIDALTLSIGGNDVGFADIIASCALANTTCSDDPFFLPFKELQLAGIPAKLGRLRDALTALNAPRVFFTEYPDGVHMDHDNVCPEITLEGAIENSIDLHIGHDDLVWGSDFIRRLDLSTQNTIGRFAGWTYIGSLNDRFERHGYCMADTWETHFNVSERKQGDERGTFHPNSGGLNAYATAIMLQWLGDGISQSAPFWTLPPGNTVPSSCGTLHTGEGLYPGSNLYSCDGRFVLVMQTDGRLVLFQLVSGGATQLWANNVGGLNGNSYTLMQSDGNFVTYAGPVGGAVFSTNTQFFPGARLVVQNDGNVVVYDTADIPHWASNTCCR